MIIIHVRGSNRLNKNPTCLCIHAFIRNQKFMFKIRPMKPSLKPKSYTPVSSHIVMVFIVYCDVYILLC